MPKIFIRYRRTDTAPYAGRLSEDLIDRFGRDSVFTDVDTVAPGRDYVTEIRKARLGGVTVEVRQAG